MMDRTWWGALALAGVVALAGTARAEEIPGLRATGVDARGSVLPAGAADPHWTLLSAPTSVGLLSMRPATVASPHRRYVPNDPVGGAGSSWIGIQRDLRYASPAGVYVYVTTFDLTGFDPATARIAGRFAVDNGIVDVVLNGTSLGPAGSGYDRWSSLQVASGFEPGVNVLSLVVVNTGPDPSGLRVELSGSADLLPTDVEVDVVVKPGSEAGTVNPRSRGRLPVAILSTADVDAADVDPATVELGGAAVSRRGDGSPMASLEDVDDDGVADLVLHFATQDVDWSGVTDALPLEGALRDGTTIVGEAAVRLVPSGRARSR